MQPDSPEDILARRLFEAARCEQPSNHIKQRALQDATRRTSEHTKRLWSLAAVALLGTIGALWVVAQQAAPPEPTISREPLRAVAPVHSTPAPAERVVTAPSEPTTTAQPKRVKDSPTPSVRDAIREPAAASLEAELEMLDGARQALLAGNPNAALAILSQYDKVATRRHLDAEASLLKIQSLAAIGRTQEASALASTFVANNPDSPLVDRARHFVQ